MTSHEDDDRLPPRIRALFLRGWLLVAACGISGLALLVLGNGGDGAVALGLGALIAVILVVKLRQVQRALGSGNSGPGADGPGADGPSRGRD